jgi:hypothetical protein
MSLQNLLSTLALAAAALAQSPLSLPFNQNNGLGANSGIFFDLNVTDPSGITITNLDVNSSSTSGTVGSIEIYTTPTTYVGSQQVPANWTLAASGGVISAGTNQPSPVCLSNGGVFLPTGSYGIFVRHVNVAISYTNSTGTVTVSTAEVSFSGGQSATSVTLFTSAPIANRIFNGNIYYNVGNVPGGPCPPFGSATTFGTGCYGPNGDSWYENFAAGLTAFDLAGTPGAETVIVAGPIGAAGYAVSAGAPAWFTPVAPKVLSNAATPAAMTDDTMSGPQVLPFTFPFPGGSASVMHVTVNGFVHLGPTTLTTGDFTPTAAEMHTLQPRLFTMWGDWQAATNVPTNPASGVYFDVDPSGQTVYFTWLDLADRRGQVPVAGATTVSFQCAIHSNGSVEYRYRNNTPAATGVGAVMVGFSKGNLNVSGGPTSVDTGSRDISATMPFNTNGPDLRPLAVTSNAPRFGQNWNINTTAIDPISPVSITFFGAGPVNPGLDLGFLGAPGCNAHINSILTSLTATATNGASTVTIPVPNTPSLGGATLAAQSACLTLANALGLLTSNGLDVTIGL